MPIYNSAINPKCLDVGRSMTLFDGTDANAPLSSVAFARGHSPSAMDGGTSFFCSGMGGESISIEASNTDVDGDYVDVSGSLTADGNGNAAFTDTGRAAFYRVTKTAGTPVVKAQR